MIHWGFLRVDTQGYSGSLDPQQVSSAGALEGYILQRVPGSTAVFLGRIPAHQVYLGFQSMRFEIKTFAEPPLCLSFSLSTPPFLEAQNLDFSSE